MHSLAALSGHDNLTQYNQSAAHMSNSSQTWEAAISNPEVAGGIVAFGSAPAMYGGTAALTNGVFAKGIGVSSALKRLVGSGALGYLAVDQVADGVPSTINAVGDIVANGLSASNVGKLSWEIGTSYAPGALGLLGRNGEYAGAALEIVDLSYSVTERVTKKNEQREE